MCTMFSHCTPSLGSSSRSSGCASARPRTNDSIFFSPPESVPACCVEPALEDREAREQRLEGVEAAVGAHQREVVAHAQVVEHRPLLRAVADAERAPRVGSSAVDRAAFEAHAAGAARQLAEQQLQQRALADAVAADDAEHFARARPRRRRRGRRRRRRSRRRRRRTRGAAPRSFLGADVDRLHRGVGLDRGDAALGEQRCRCGARRRGRRALRTRLMSCSMTTIVAPRRSLAQRMTSITGAVSWGDRPAQGSSSSSRRGSPSSAIASSRICRSPCESCRRGALGVGEERIARAQLVEQRARPAAQARPQQVERAGARALQRAIARLSAIVSCGEDRRDLELAADAEARRCGASAGGRSPGRRSAPGPPAPAARR